MDDLTAPESEAKVSPSVHKPCLLQLLLTPANRSEQPRRKESCREKGILGTGRERDDHDTHEIRAEGHSPPPPHGPEVHPGLMGFVIHPISSGSTHGVSSQLGRPREISNGRRRILDSTELPPGCPNSSPYVLEDDEASLEGRGDPELLLIFPHMHLLLWCSARLQSSMCL
ncbi:unnamed protein product [Pleuronectes platessa]|uniref:Uncharacterized protein n=1 Tax=Pleuronectes platessa TaxID=8262 RepID=A0A9N7YEY8_PLEPL|nr:unnamed protein product [Pleuronectes platessa]